jgi:predicted HNH restriction endonuclease
MEAAVIGPDEEQESRADDIESADTLKAIQASLETEVDGLCSKPLQELRALIVKRPSEGRVRSSFAEGVIYDRDKYVVAFAKRRAGMQCEVPDCQHPLFHKPNGLPYVEVHHLMTLAEGGPDTVGNVVCLCPTHHREMHFGVNATRLTRLLEGIRAAEDL